MYGKILASLTLALVASSFVGCSGLNSGSIPQAGNSVRQGTACSGEPLSGARVTAEACLPTPEPTPPSICGPGPCTVTIGGGGGVFGGGGGGGGGCGGGAVTYSTTRSTMDSCGNNPGGGGGTQVAILPWAIGQQCYDSTAKVQENVPPNTTDDGHAVATIDKITINLGDHSAVVGFVYIDKNNQLWVGPSPGYIASGGNFWSQVAAVVPVLGPLVNIGTSNLGNAFYPVSSSDLAKMKAQPFFNQPGGTTSITGCFQGGPSSAIN